MRICTFLAMVMFTFSSGYSQTEVSLTHNFEVGNTYQFEIKRGKEDSRDPSSQGAFTVTLAKATVTKGNKNRRTITLLYGETRIEGDGIPQEVKEQYKGQDLYYGIEISLIVDEEGNFFELSNYENVKMQLESAMIKMYKSQGTKIDEATFGLIQQQLAITYDTEEKLLDTYFPELSIYFNAFGNLYTKDVPQKVNYESNNPFGGEPFPITSKVVFKELNGRIAIINGIETIKPEDLNRIMKSTFKNIAESAGRTFNESEIPEFNIITTSEMRYNTDENALISVVMNKQIIANGLEQNAITEIRMVQ
jgi:hypothetical protein